VLHVRLGRLSVPQGLCLLDYLAQITDPRHRRGRRHTLGTVLAVAVAAVLAAARVSALARGFLPVRGRAVALR
jgi:hypothetical protein